MRSRHDLSLHTLLGSAVLAAFIGLVGACTQGGSQSGAHGAEESAGGGAGGHAEGHDGGHGGEQAGGGGHDGAGGHGGAHGSDHGEGAHGEGAHGGGVHGGAGHGHRGAGHGKHGGGEGHGGGAWEDGVHVADTGGSRAGHDPALGGEHRHHGGHHRFDDPEKWAAEFDSPERLAWQKPDAVIAKLKLAKSALVADLGAGTGTFAVRFAAAVPEGKVIANDIEATMVAYLGERAKKEGLGNLVAVQGAAGDPKLPEMIDVAFMCDVFHHVEDIPGFFAKVRGQLREGGRLVIVDFKKDAPEDAPGPPKAMRVRSSDVVKQLTEVGFRVAEVDSTTLEFQYIVIMERG